MSAAETPPTPRRFRALLWIAIGIALALAAGLWFAHSIPPTYKNRYRLTLEVEDNGKIYSGSSVFEHELRKLPPNLNFQSVDRKFRGEATPVELDNDRVLVALLYSSHTTFGRSDRPNNNPWTAYYFIGRSRGWDTEWRNGRNETLERLRRYPKDTPLEIRPEDLPALIVFRDRRDPMTAEPADPRDLAKALGPGVRLKRATIEITGAPLSNSIEQQFPWLRDRLARHAAISGHTGSMDREDFGAFPNTIHAASLKWD